MTNARSFDTVNYMEKPFKLNRFGPRLWGRDRAEMVRRLLEKQLANLDVGDTIVVGLEGVEVFDLSFASEMFGQAIRDMPFRHAGRFLLVEGLTEYTQLNLQKCLEDMELVVPSRSRRVYDLLGKHHPSDLTTYRAIHAQEGKMTAAELSGRLAIKLTAANQRLAKFLKLGLARRESALSESGREHYVYYALR